MELLKATIGSEYAPVVTTLARHTPRRCSMTAVLVRAGATDDEITTNLTGLLPDGYRGNSLKELPEWIKSAREKGFDEADEEMKKYQPNL